ncbi:sensor domain-containing diguanylate cyclase [Vibrio sp. 404]|uniref:Sensor domain-containing diguanylate cyclase n=1 Tax=Vibrio marinisediminis TaxID=2758441 RepID=A0A7W2FU85_9VIBR|nr:sensor domain-containing diguanylate cyclase [Vibrio marinisediminis]MBA5764330.1 sensor domain-containing diguanylate cyclase [Vibrio marinisediminis]
MRRLLRIGKNMLVLWLGLSLIPILYYWYVNSKTQAEISTQLQAQGLQFLSYVDERASTIYSEIEQTSYEIGHSSLLYDFARKQDPQLKRYLEKQWYISSLNSSRFDQLRFLDQQGDEVIRVDFPHGSEKPAVVSKDQLQNKTHRDYFLLSQKLTPNQVGYVGIDLEFEHTKPVLPYKPGFRIIYPIDKTENNDKTRLGYFIANLDVLQLIQDITQNNQQLPVHFINQQSYYVLSNDQYKLFGNLIHERRRFQLAQQHPDLWQHIQQQPSAGSYLTDDGLYIYQRAKSPLFGTIKDLTIITLYPQILLVQNATASMSLILLEVSIIWLALGMFACLSAVMFDTYRRNVIEHAFTNLLLESSNAIVLTDSQFHVLRVNCRYIELTGYKHEQLLGESLHHLQQLPVSFEKLNQTLRKQHYWKGSLDVCTSTQQRVNCEVEIRPLATLQPSPVYYVHSFTDITTHHQRIAELQTMSECDSATKLWNKSKFETLLENQAQLIARYPQHPPCCLAIIDIDDFKSINDSRGHAFGDKAILYVASKLQQVMRDSDEIGRIGGDEFAMIIQHITPELAVELMIRVKQLISSWSEYPITISVGVAELGSNWKVSFEQADNALYHAKHAGRNCVIAHGINNLTSIEHHSI